jgi:CubicO group peptidase (beta-lactamase class C family)
MHELQFPVTTVCRSVLRTRVCGLPILLSLLVITACSGGGYPPEEWNLASCANNADSQFTDPRAQQASSLLEAALKTDNGSGISAAVMIDGILVWSDAVGKAGPADLSRNAKMRLGSVSKPITAALVAKLHEEGILDIDAPIQRYVAELPEKTGAITLRQVVRSWRHYQRRLCLDSLLSC